MSKHLSQEQFARCFVGVATGEERLHLIECAKCTTDLEGFGNAVSSLRHAIRDYVDARVESLPTTEIPVSRPATAGMRKVRWALATAAVILLGLLPLVTSTKPEAVVTAARPAETSPDDLMNAINTHLSRTVPAPMEPMMSLLPSDESRTE